MAQQPHETFEQTVEEGERRLARSWSSLLATGAVGGLDVSVGVMAMLLVEHATNSPALGALAFGIGFVLLSLASSELFTENFLVPVTAVLAKRGTIGGLGRLWSGTLFTNLAAGWLFALLMIDGLPYLHPDAVRVASFFPAMGTGWRAMAAAIIAGSLVTLMTWVEHASDSVASRIVVAMMVGFLMALGHLNHAIVGSLEMFTGLQGPAPFGYADWAACMGWAAIGNVLGGLLLVTMLRVVQAGGETVKAARR
jgi:formate/nitrite transporter FocA (FNT family)